MLKHPMLNWKTENVSFVIEKTAKCKYRYWFLCLCTQFIPSELVVSFKHDQQLYKLIEHNKIIFLKETTLLDF